MPISYFPLSVDVSQIVGTEVKKARLHVATNLPAGTPIAYGADGKIAVPGGVYALPGGVGEVTLPTKTGATNVSSWQYVITGEYSVDGVRPIPLDPIYIDAPATDAAVNLASFIGVTSAPATFMGAAVAQIQAKVDEGVEAATRAEAAAANASEIALGDAGAAVRAAVPPLLANERAVSDSKYALVSGAPLAQAPGKNMYDKNADFGANTFWNGGAGGPISLAGWYASAKIPVTVGATYVINSPRQVQTFDAAGGSVRYLNNTTEAPFSFTVGPTETHVAFNVAAAKRDAAQVELGAVPTAYEPYGVKVQRLLSGSNYLDTQIAELSTDASAQRAGAEIRVQKSGVNMAVRSIFDATRDVVIPVSLARSATNPGNTMVMFATDAQQVTSLVPAATPDTDVFPAYRAGVSTSIHGAGDDNCPIVAGGSYVGANHGWNAGARVVATGHGKTAADRGSRWSDGTRTYTLLRVVDANTVLFGCPYTVTAGRVTPGTVLPAAALTHVAGATNTTSVPVAGGVTLVQIYPSTHSQTATVTLDGKPLRDGAAAGRALLISESYQIVSYKGLIDWAQANVGSDPFANLSSMPQLARVSNTYRLTRATVLQSQTVTFAEAASVNMGVIQTGGLVAPAGGSLRQFIPGVGTVGSYNFSTEAVLGTSGAATINVAAQAAASEPANRAYQWAYDAAASKAYGVMIGILPVMDGKNPTRRANGTDVLSWQVLMSTRKNYPSIFYGQIVAPGVTLSGAGFRRYLPATATPEQVVSDGSRSWVYIDRSDSGGAVQIARAPELVGRALVPPAGAVPTIAPAKSYVTPEGVTYASSGPGYFVAEAVVDSSV